jgi:hypothetical protein
MASHEPGWASTSRRGPRRLIWKRPRTQDDAETPYSL